MAEKVFLILHSFGKLHIILLVALPFSLSKTQYVSANGAERDLVMLNLALL